HRIRRARAHARDQSSPPQRGSLEACLLEARDAGVGPAEMRATIASLEVTLTVTAHPTQAARHTVLEKLDRMANVLETRDRCELTPREHDEAVRALREEVTSLWQTDELRRERPTVGDEVKNVLWYAERVLWDRIPALSRALGEAFASAYGEPLGVEPSPLRLHSWVGGDMDGNPLVTPEVLDDAIRVYRSRALRLILSDVRQLGGALSQSSRYVKPPPALLESIARDEALFPTLAALHGPRAQGEPWRRKLRYVELRLEAALAKVEAARTEATAGPGEGAPAAPPEGSLPSYALGRSGIAPEPAAAVDGGHAYRGPDELAADLEILADSLARANAAHAGERAVRDLLGKVRSVGFHLRELELRALAGDVRDAAAWLRGEGPQTDAAQRFLSALWRMARAQEEAGESACRTVVLSMTKGADDGMAALYCAKESGLWDAALGCARFDVVPLFETLGALDDAPDILRTLFADPVYRRHVACRGQQEVMIGYSDSGKEVGLLAAAAALYRAQSALPALAAEAGIPLRIFHGRGESVARGGGPAQQAILALPQGSVAGRYKATEQGEALDHKYARPQLAARSLELIVGGALLHSAGAAPHPPPEDEARFVAAFDELAEEGRKAWRGLVWEEPEFLEFFRCATPQEEISKLPIGSRPAKRSAGGLDALRAIPWVFSWTQNRSILPGWYGVGTALAALAARPGGEALLLDMHRRWPFFRTVIANVEMVLAKSDLAIARRYAKLAPEPARAAVWPRIEAEHRLTRRWVKRIVGAERLLDDNPPLQRSIALRNPYVDPMSFLQVDLLRRKRGGEEGTERPLLLTLSGIAAGMRNTG
ncbi:MAG TPA: phosphoenolpyruvate carboxylase, partial [Vulgatibacter sp.]